MKKGTTQTEAARILSKIAASLGKISELVSQIGEIAESSEAPCVYDEFVFKAKKDRDPSFCWYHGMRTAAIAYSKHKSIMTANLEAWKTYKNLGGCGDLSKNLLLRVESVTKEYFCATLDRLLGGYYFLWNTDAEPFGVYSPVFGVISNAGRIALDAEPTKTGIDLLLAFLDTLQGCGVDVGLCKKAFFERFAGSRILGCSKKPTEAAISVVVHAWEKTKNTKILTALLLCPWCPSWLLELYSKPSNKEEHRSSVAGNVGTPFAVLVEMSKTDPLLWIRDRALLTYEQSFSAIG